MLPKAKAIEDAIRGGVRRVHVIFVQVAGQHPRRSVHERRHRHADRREHQRADRRRNSRRSMSHEPAWDKGTPLDERVLRYTAGEDHALDNRLVAYDVRASIAHAEMLHAAGPARRRTISKRFAHGLTEIAAEHARGEWQRAARARGRTDGARESADRSASARPASACTSAARATIRCSRRCACICAMPSTSCSEGVNAVADALDELGAARGRRRSCPATPTCSRRCRARSRCGPAVSRPSCATMRKVCASAAARAEESARLRRRLRHAEPAARSRATRAAARLRAVHEPVTAVQLSRGKAEAQLLFEITLVMQDVGRLAADLLLFYTQEFSFVELPDAFTTGSSIMPQKRNPDVFELIRGRTRHRAGLPARSAGHRREAAVRLSARSAAHQGAAVPRHRPVPRHARDSAGGAAPA